MVCHFSLFCRTAQFLNLLAQVDVMCCNVNDSQVKLQGIEGLLQLESRFQPYDITSKNHNTDESSELSSQLERLTLERVSDKDVFCIRGMFRR